MYIGTSTAQLTGVTEKMDKINFTFSIKPESIPFLDKYGVRIIATPYTLSDIAQITVPEIISKLDDPSLSLSGIRTEGRTIIADINYGEDTLRLNTVALYNEGGIQ